MNFEKSVGTQIYMAKMNLNLLTMVEHGFQSKKLFDCLRQSQPPASNKAVVGLDYDGRRAEGLRPAYSAVMAEGQPTLRYPSQGGWCPCCRIEWCSRFELEFFSHTNLETHASAYTSLEAHTSAHMRAHTSLGAQQSAVKHRHAWEPV